MHRPRRRAAEPDRRSTHHGTPWAGRRHGTPPAAGGQPLPGWRWRRVDPQGRRGGWSAPHRGGAVRRPSWTCARCRSRTAGGAGRPTLRRRKARTAVSTQPAGALLAGEGRTWSIHSPQSRTFSAAGVSSRSSRRPIQHHHSVGSDLNDGRAEGLFGDLARRRAGPRPALFPRPWADRARLVDGLRGLHGVHPVHPSGPGNGGRVRPSSAFAPRERTPVGPVKDGIVQGAKTSAAPSPSRFVQAIRSGPATN